MKNVQKSRKKALQEAFCAATDEVKHNLGMSYYDQSQALHEDQDAAYRRISNLRAGRTPVTQADIDNMEAGIPGFGRIFENYFQQAIESAPKNDNLAGRQVVPSMDTDTLLYSQLKEQADYWRQQYEIMRDALIERRKKD